MACSNRGGGTIRTARCEYGSWQLCSRDPSDLGGKRMITTGVHETPIPQSRAGRRAARSQARIKTQGLRLGRPVLPRDHPIVSTVKNEFSQYYDDVSLRGHICEAPGANSNWHVAYDEVTDEDQGTQFEAVMSSRSGRFLGRLYRDTSGTRESS